MAQQSLTQLPSQIERSSIACRYLDLLGLLDWDQWWQQIASLPTPGPTPSSLIPYVGAYLIKLDCGLRTMTALRRYLVHHPELVWLLGFPLRPCSYQPWGFDIQAAVPAVNRLSQVLRRLDNQLLQQLLTQTVVQLQRRLPASAHFGQTISLDTKHIVAWVRQNNPKAFVKEGRFNKKQQPAGDPDCRLGCKRRANQHYHRSTPHHDGQPARHLGIGRAELYWGYASGVVVTMMPNFGEFVLAEMTQTFDLSDISYFKPLMKMVEQRLGFAPPNGALDAAFDAHYVYDYFHQAGGLAAIPKVTRGRDQQRRFSPDGLPLCPANLPMSLKQTFMHRTSLVPHQRGRYVCPLLHPQPTGQICPVNHQKWPSGGCKTTLATSVGARLRHQIDRQSPQYKAIYRQRIAVERIFSQAYALGIERPKLRNQLSITNQNTLTYILINLRALARLQTN